MTTRRIVLSAMFGLAGLLSAREIGLAADDYLKIRFKDSKGITEIQKLVMQAAASLILVTLLYVNPAKPDLFWALYVPFLNHPLLVWHPIAGYAFFLFTMIAFSNATNLSDGLDGLASGMGILLYVPFGIVAYVIGNFVAAQYLKLPFLPGTGELRSRPEKNLQSELLHPGYSPTPGSDRPNATDFRRGHMRLPDSGGILAGTGDHLPAGRSDGSDGV